MEIKLLAICGSPVKGEITNTEYMLREAIKSCKEHGGRFGDDVKADLILLGEEKIN